MSKAATIAPVESTFKQTVGTTTVRKMKNVKLLAGLLVILALLASGCEGIDSSSVRPRRQSPAQSRQSRRLRLPRKRNRRKHFWISTAKRLT